MILFRTRNHSARISSLEIAFTTEALRELCADQGQCKEKFGEKAGLCLIEFLADMRAADSIYDLPVRRPRVSEENSAISFAEVGQEFTVTCSANHIENPINGEGLVDWCKVYRIKIVSLENAGVRHE